MSTATTPPAATRDTLIDPVRTLRELATSTTILQRHLRDAMLDVCNEVESLRVDAYEAHRREEELGSLTITGRHYRVVGARADGTRYESITMNQERHAMGLQEELWEDTRFGIRGATIESRPVMVGEWFES